MTDFTPLSLGLADVCRRAGQFIRQEAAAFDRSRVETKGKHDLVSYVDQETERLLVAGLRELLPEAGFITEEGTTGGSSQATSAGTDYTWIIDPLDGTTNFVHGLPCYCVSVGMLHHGELSYDQVGRVTEIRGKALELSARETGVLEILLQRVGRIVSKEQLVERLCEWGEEVSTNAIEVYVHRLRKKLEAGGVRIVTVRGLGYCLEKPKSS